MFRPHTQVLSDIQTLQKCYACGAAFVSWSWKQLFFIFLHNISQARCNIASDLWLIILLSLQSKKVYFTWRTLEETRLNQRHHLWMKLSFLCKCSRWALGQIILQTLCMFSLQQPWRHELVMLMRWKLVEAGTYPDSEYEEVSLHKYWPKFCLWVQP